jgi:hypothetical protein
MALGKTIVLTSEAAGRLGLPAADQGTIFSNIANADRTEGLSSGT